MNSALVILPPFVGRFVLPTPSIYPVSGTAQGKFRTFSIDQGFPSLPAGRSGSSRYAALVDSLDRPAGVVARARAWLERALGVGLPTLAASGAGIPANPTYPVDVSLATMARNPWVWACVEAIVTDLCGLPLVAETGNGLEKEQIRDHWLLALLDRPSPKVSGLRFRRQLVTDLVLTGNAYVRVWTDASGRATMLGRVIPAGITAEVGRDGEVTGWVLPSTGERLRWDQVRHIAGPSWSQSNALVYGTSPVEPLSLGLQVDRDSRKQSGRAAKRGRLEMMLTPASPEVVLGRPAVDALVSEYATATESGNGLYVVNKNMEATPLTLTAREGEFLGISDRLRSEVLAAFSVPPVRVSEPAANYGTAKQQMRTYWETLQGRASLIDAELSQLAEPGVRIRHSFAEVEALQTSRTERLARVVTWVSLGMKPPAAATYEGFVDAPVPANAPAAPKTPSTQPQVDNPRADTPTMAAVTHALSLVRQLLTEGEPDEQACFAGEMLIRHALRDTANGNEVAREAAAICLASAIDPASPVFGATHARRIVAQATTVTEAEAK